MYVHHYMNIQVFISVTVVQFQGNSSANESEGSISFTVRSLERGRERSFTVRVCTRDGTAIG